MLVCILMSPPATSQNIPPPHTPKTSTIFEKKKQKQNTDSKTVPLLTKTALCCLRANYTLKGGQIY